MSRATVRCETSSPSFSNSPWMRGAPQSGFASAMVRTRSASLEETRGRPVLPRRDFQVQKARKPCRCQRITVSGRTRWSASRHPAHRVESHTQRRRSRRPNCGRFDRRRSRASCCRSARFSSVRSVRVLSAARRAPNRASTRAIGLMARTPLAHRPVSGGSFGKRHLPMPANHRLGANYVERITPPCPLVGEPHPEEAIEERELRSLRSAAKQGELLT